MTKLISTNPSRNYDILGEMAVSTPAEVAAAVIRARTAQPVWQALGVRGRVDVLNKLTAAFERRRDEMALLQSREMGMPIAESGSSIDFGLAYWRRYLAHAEADLKPIVTYKDDTEIAEVHSEPCGVAAVIVPWNFPFINFVWGVGQCMIAGSAVVFKCSEEVPLFGKLIESCFAEAGVPEGVFIPVYGAGDVGAELLRQPIDLVIFTGSSATGKIVYKTAAEKMIPVLMELGGSDPGIVFADANLDKVADDLFVGKFSNCGQVCNGLKRLIVHRSRFDEVVLRLAEIIRSKKVGDAEDSTTDIGPLVSKRQLELLEAQVADACSKGATLLTGGKRPDKLQGAYFSPTLVTSVTADMRIWKEEVFGPVLPVVAFDSYDEAIQLARDTLYGLGSYIFTEDKALAQRAAADMRAGMVQINNTTLCRPCNPFGGRGNSGLGMEHGQFGFHDVTRRKLVTREV